MTTFDLSGQRYPPHCYRFPQIQLSQHDVWKSRRTLDHSIRWKRSTAPLAPHLKAPVTSSDILEAVPRVARECSIVGEPHGVSARSAVVTKMLWERRNAAPSAESFIVPAARHSGQLLSCAADWGQRVASVIAPSQLCLRIQSTLSAPCRPSRTCARRSHLARSHLLRWPGRH